MTGMEHVIAIRQRGAKPEAVTVRLVDEPWTHPFGLTWFDFGADYGHVTVEVPRADRLSELDMRPLHGLFVTVEDVTGDHARLRRVGEMVAAVEPETLIVLVHDGQALLSAVTTMRRNGAVETFDLKDPL